MPLFHKMRCTELERNGVLETLADHESRIRETEKETVRQETQIENLVKSIEKLCESNRDFVSTIKWGIGISLPIIIAILGYLFTH